MTFTQLTPNQLDTKLAFIEQYIQAANPAEGSKLDANANVTMKTITSLEAELHKDINIQINRRFMTDELRRAGVPVVTPPGGLGCHLNAMEFLPHVEQGQYPAGALASALYIAGGVRGMERGTMSEAREPDGREVFSQMELLRLAMPRRVFTLSQVKYAIDRIIWLYEHRDLIGGLTFVEEPAILRFFFGKLKPTSDWQTDLAKAFREDFGDSL